MNRLLILAPMMLAATPAMADDDAAKAAPVPSVAGYLCTFAGKCDGEDGPSETRDAPDTKGFRLARPVSDATSGSMASSKVPRVAAQPVRSKGRTVSVSSAGDRAAVATANRYAAAPTSVVGSGGVAARPRADLMIGFDLNSARLTAEGLVAAQVFAKSLLTPELQAKRFLIEGHTDLRGGRDINMRLSRARAQAVADYLVAMGVQRDRLQTRGYGPDMPIPGHRSTDPTNRRVEAELIS